MKGNNNIFFIVGAIVVAFLLFGGKLFSGQQAILPSGVVNRQITAGLPGQPVTVKLTFAGGSGKYGGIISETLPSGFAVTGISSVLGVSGSASGKVTGQLYEIAFAVDNSASPSITYTLSSPSTGGSYPLTGTFAFAEGGPSGTVGGQNSIVLCSPNCAASSTVCTGLTFADGCSGVCTGTKALTCTQPTDKCVQAATVQAGCLLADKTTQKMCDGSWTVTKNTAADADCNNLIANTELLAHIQKWVSNTVTNTELLGVITAWVSS